MGGIVNLVFKIIEKVIHISYFINSNFLKNIGLKIIKSIKITEFRTQASLLAFETVQ